MLKSTYGTGCFALLNTGADMVRSKNRLLTTIAYRLVSWWVPIVSGLVAWFAFARFRADREAACDSAVLAASRGDTRRAYGRALLKLSGTSRHPA